DCASGPDRHRGAAGLRASAHLDHADRAGWTVGHQSGAHHRLLHAHEVRKVQPLPYAVSDADLLYRADADFLWRCDAHPQYETSGMKRLLLIPAFLLGWSLAADAQCVMCYRTAHAQNEARSRVMNLGILALGAPPFLILAGFCAFVYKKN